MDRPEHSIEIGDYPLGGVRRYNWNSRNSLEQSGNLLFLSRFALYTRLGSTLEGDDVLLNSDVFVF